MAKVFEPEHNVMLQRIVVTGSECTGKTTLAAQLATHYRTLWVPEYSRKYADLKAGELEYSDVEPIARGQIAAEEACMAQADGVLIQDTDLLSTVVYSYHYYEACPEWVEQTAHERIAPLYLLLHPDVPWIPDGVRDRGHKRDEMHRLFHEALLRWQARTVDITGNWSARFETARQAIDAVLTER